jgi:hypothetical protein
LTQTYGSHETKIYYAEESTYGVTPTAPTMLSIPAESIEPQINPNNIKVRGVGSVDLQAVKAGQRSPSLKLSFPVPSDAPISFLQYARIELDKSLSMQLLYYKGVFSAATDIISLVYSGCKFKSTTVQCSIDDVVKCAVDLIGQNVQASTGKITDAAYADYAGAVPFYQSYIKKGNSTLERVTDWKFTVENNLKAVPVIRSTAGNIIKYLPNRQRDLTGEVVFEFESKEEFDDIINDTEFNLEFGLGDSNKAILGGCKWENASIPTKIEDLVSLKASFVAKTIAIS